MAKRVPNKRVSRKTVRKKPTRIKVAKKTISAAKHMRTIMEQVGEPSVSRKELQDAIRKLAAS